MAITEEAVWTEMYLLWSKAQTCKQHFAKDNTDWK